MENVLNLTPVELFIILASHAWIFIIFPVLVLKKLNYMTALLEAQFEPNDSES